MGAVLVVDDAGYHRQQAFVPFLLNEEPGARAACRYQVAGDRRHEPDAKFFVNSDDRNRGGRWLHLPIAKASDGNHLIELSDYLGGGKPVDRPIFEVQSR